MHLSTSVRPAATALFVASALAAFWGLAGCGGVAGALDVLGSPFPPPTGGGGTTTGPGSTGTTPGGANTGNAGTEDPCDETQSRKFVRISMRNTSPDFIQYFLVLIAFENGTTYPSGGVCPDDVGLYTSFGYTYVPEGSRRTFGNYCIEGPGLFYFHRAGQFQTVGGTTLGSAIAPAQGSLPTFDSFFTNTGAQVPVPDLILFHNPGTTAQGRALRVAVTLGNPCNPLASDVATPNCEQDSFYYVDENGIRAGSAVMGTGSYVRVPAEIQGTGCECGFGDDAFQRLGQPGTVAATASCSEFLRGGKLEYAFLRIDAEPPIPQAVWRVSDASGQRVHDFDPQAGIR